VTAGVVVRVQYPLVKRPSITCCDGQQVTVQVHLLILRLPSLSPTLPRMGIPEICCRLSRLIYVGMEVIDITHDLTKTTSHPFIPRTSVF